MSLGVIKRTFSVLEALASANRAMPLRELSRGIHLPKPTVYRILQSLRKLGYVAQDRKSGFYLTATRLALLGRNSQSSQIKRQALPFMERIYRQFDETTNLAVLEGSLIRYVHVLETNQPLRHMIEPDETDTFYTTSLGRAIVSHLPQEEQDRLVEGITLKPRTAKSVTNKAALKKILARAGKLGYAEDDEENDMGVICLGVPILERGYPVAAISLSLPKVRLTPQRKRDMIDALKSVNG